LQGDDGISQSEFKDVLKKQRPPLLADSKLVRDLTEVWGKHGFPSMAPIVKAIEKYALVPSVVPKKKAGAPLKWGNQGNLSAWLCISSDWHKAKQKQPQLSLDRFLKETFKRLKNRPWVIGDGLELRDAHQARNRFAKGKLVAEKNEYLKLKFPHWFVAQKSMRKPL
jgi:hypothetical protein